MKLQAEDREAAIAASEVAWTEPWQARAVALTLEVMHSLGLSWEDFRRELMAAVGVDPHRPYYTSWLEALEQLATTRGGIRPDELVTQRMRASAYWTDEAGDDDLEVFPIAVDEQSLLELTEVFGPLVDCAHVELQRQWIDGAPRTWMFRAFDSSGAPRVTVLLPSPFLGDDEQRLDEPDWSRLGLWDRLRERFLGLPPDPVDRSGDGFRHP